MNTETPRSAELKPHDRAAACFGVVSAAAILLTPWLIQIKGSTPWWRGPLIFPLSCLFVIFLVSIPSLIRLVRTRSFSVRAIAEALSFQRKSLFLLVMFLLFLPGMYLVGIELSVFLLLFVSLVGLDQKKYALPVTAAITFITWFVFVYLLEVYFPEPLILSLFGGNHV